MSELTLALIKLGYLALLWMFVLTTVSVMRSDLFGTRERAAAPVARAPRPASRPPRAPRTSRGTPRRVVVIQGSLAGTSIPLGDSPITIGRAADSTLVLDDDYASGHHARIYAANDGWVVEDLGSTNGTYLDRSRVTGPTPIPPGVPIRIGKTVMELRK